MEVSRLRVGIPFRYRILWSSGKSGFYYRMISLPQMNTDYHGCIENFIRLDLCESVANFFVLGLLSFFAFGNPYFDVVGIRVIKKPAEKTSRFMIQD